MRKQERQKLIVQLLSDYNIQKQEELVEALEKNNVKVTQATISRDIKELKLVKVPAASGTYCYSIPVESDEDLGEKLAKLLKDAFVSIDEMDKFVILKTLPGNSGAIANLIDRQFSDILFAILNDDDNILMIARSLELRGRLFQSLQRYIQ
ncbi:MAG TPA: ArgR family transcriptional regulator [Tetragenococcus sp.]|nr:ArgR family transcriptional regulator [Tetragenococcus sp.]